MLSIENVSLDDVQPLAELYEELTGGPSNLEKMAQNLRRIKEDPDYIVLVAKEEDLIVGSVMGIICLDLVGDCRPFMVIENVIVKGLWHGKEIGTQLMEEIEKIGSARNCYYTMLVSGGHRKEAHQFYEKVGYDSDVRGFKKYL